MVHHSDITLCLVVACARNGTIGRDNQLPWHIPNDLQHFRAVTMGKPLIMGRKTYESIGKPLPGRTNIVVSKSWSQNKSEGKLPEVPGLKIADNFDAAFNTAAGVAEINGVDEIMVIGGAQLYQLALPSCRRIYLTEIHADVTGDSFFTPPERGDGNEWQEIAREDVKADGSNLFDYSFCVLEKRVSTDELELNQHS